MAMKTKEELIAAVKGLRIVYDMTHTQDRYRVLQGQIDALNWVIGE